MCIRDSYVTMVGYYIEAKDYDKAKECIKEAIDKDSHDEVLMMSLKYRNFILQDRELSNKVTKYLLDVGDVLDARNFYNNIDDDLKDLYIEKVLEVGYEYYTPDFLYTICEKRPEKVREFVLKYVESKLKDGPTFYDHITWFIEEAKKCMSREEFSKLLDEIEVRHYKKRKFIEKISSLRG